MMTNYNDSLVLPCEKIMPDWFNPLDFESDVQDELTRLTQQDGFLFWLPGEQFYSIILEQFETEEQAEKAFHKVRMQLDRWCKKDHPAISCFAGLSKTKGRGAIKTMGKSKRGRPCIKVKGRKDPLHIHIIVGGGGEGEAKLFCIKFTKAYNERYNKQHRKEGEKDKRPAKYIPMDCLAFISYVSNQSYRTAKRGPFNFARYTIPYDSKIFPKRRTWLQWLDDQDGGKRVAQYDWRERAKRQAKEVGKDDRNNNLRQEVREPSTRRVAGEKSKSVRFDLQEERKWTESIDLNSQTRERRAQKNRYSF